MYLRKYSHDLKLSNLFFCSDTHFFHKSICKYSNRPYGNLEEMHNDIVSKFNSKITPKDTLILIGDITFGDLPETKKILDAINGHKILVCGNHDDSDTEKLFSNHSDFLKLRVFDLNNEKHNLVLCHYALRVWHKSHHGSISLYGHSHGSLPGEGKQMDVGVDTNNMYPYSFDEIMERMNNIDIKKVDHH